MKEPMTNKSAILAEIQAKRLSAAEGFRLLKQLREPEQSVRRLRYYRPVWEPATIPVSNHELKNGMMLLLDEGEVNWRRFEESGYRTVLVKPGTSYSKLEERLYTVRPDQADDYAKLFMDLASGQEWITEVVHLWSFASSTAPEQMLVKGLYALHALAQVVLDAMLQQPIQWIYGYPAQPELLPEHEGVCGFIQCLHREHPHWSAKTIEVDAANGLWETILDEVRAYEAGATEVSYTGGERSVRVFIEEEGFAASTEPIWKQDGLYLITGGSGGLGLALAEHAVRSKRVSLILAGRSFLGKEASTRIEAMNATGSRVQYVQADISKREEVFSLMADIKRSDVPLSGIIHAAGSLRDMSLQSTTRHDLADVLEPKALGARFLAEALEGAHLDFFLLFSSLISWVGNEGQAGYGFANRYLDAFAEMRRRNQQSTPETGTTVSIAWPLWLDGGMKVDETTRQWMEQTMGLIPLSTERGAQAMADALLLAKQMNYSQWIIVEGMSDNILSRKRGKVLSSPPIHTDLQHGSEMRLSELKEQAEGYLRKIVSEEMHVPMSKIKNQDPFDKFGIDSVLIVTLTRRLEIEFGTLPKTLFFEYQSIAELSDYFVATHQGKLSQMFALSPVTQKIQSKPIVPVEDFRLSKLAPSEQIEADAIAVIGIGGRYPMADDLHEYWENLKAGQDCITEIPSERWNHDEWFDPDKSKEGTVYTKWGGFLNGVDQFDPLFFQISPKEAELMDPQERLFLETVWHTFEDAGYTRRSIGTKNVGVYVGVMYGQYQLFGVEETYKGHPVAPSSSYASIANRVSYVFDLQGPSMALDTMCSSSLTAIHLACDSLRKGESEIAIAGGVNVSIHPSKYLFLSQGKFASTDGRCRSFGEGGDGYVPGEGVGAVLLKPLAKALADGDNIYAIIRGSTLNHGGKTNGYTVPSPHAQGKLISDALRLAKVEPAQISYMEAHGTGTSLGDPIEIAGLAKAFAKLDDPSARVPIGSVKSNIGHLESAAGIAGLTKIIFQMKHEQLVPSLHAQTLNPNIDFEGSPFYVQRQLAPWEPRGGRRIAGISSFGAGGANAHVVLEQWRGPVIRSLVEPGVQQLVLLSARNIERLRTYGERMLAFLLHNQKGIDLSNFAFTLQIGREEFDERLALTVGSVEELTRKLEFWLAGQKSIDGLYSGNSKQMVEETNRDAIKAMLASKNLHQLALRWVSGAEQIDWKELHTHGSRRISLPGYPFQRDRYWISSDDSSSSSGEVRLHPLVGRNDSTFDEQKYSTLLSNREWVLRDHKVGHSILLPGAAAVEMARAAAECALGVSVAQLRNVLWKSPLTYAGEDFEAKRVSVGLNLLETGGVAFELWTELSNSQRLVHCTGEMDAAEIAINETEILPITDISARCSTMLGAKECYEFFAATGLKYGESFRCLSSVRFHEKEALAALRLPEHLGRDANQFGLHPAMLDGIFQAVIGLFDSSADFKETYLPSGISEMTILGSLLDVRYAYVVETSSANHNCEAPEQRSFDLQAVDAEGRVILKINSFTVHRHVRTRADDDGSIVLLRPIWQNSSLDENVSIPFNDGDILLFDQGRVVWKELRVKLADAGSSARVILVQPGEHLVRVGEDLYEISPDDPDMYRRLLAELIRDGRKPNSIIHLWSQSPFNTDVEALSKAQRMSIYALQALVQGYQHEKIKGPTRLIYGSRAQIPTQPLYQAVNAWLKTLVQEIPAFCCRSLMLDEAPEACLDLLMLEMADMKFGCDVIRFERGSRLIRSLQPLSLPSPMASTDLVRSEGAYLIAGGAGGLGLLFARDLATRCNGVNLVLTGRSTLTAHIQERIMELQRLGANVTYMQADLSRSTDVRLLVDQVKLRHGAIRGILHSAGVLQDGLIYRSTNQSVAQVLVPKVQGAVLLDELTKTEPLDFFVLFSSLTGELGNVGQSSYAYANHFQDSFAKWRAGEQQAGRRHGRSLSVNWPLWKEGGMRVDEAKLAQLQAKMPGLRLLSTENGCAALDACLQTEEAQLVVVQGEPEKLSWLYEGVTSPSVSQQTSESVSTVHVDEDVRQRLEMYIKQLLSRQIRLVPEKIAATEALESYGVDSVMVLNMTSTLEAKFGTLSKTLLFEYRSVRELANYFLAEHRERVVQEFGSGLPVNVKVHVKPPSRTYQPRDAPKLKKRAVALEEERIAIIGISGKYPMAANLDAFWSNLQAGRDCITEIPQTRWNHSRYFNPDKSGKGTAYSKWGGFLDDIDCFDPRHFNISPREARLIDPQERLFLQTVWHTLEDAGYTKSRLSAQKVGVFVGAMYAQYQMVGMEQEITGREVPASSFASIANRVSYFFNFHGPSIAIDTMCSSSLTAIHLACKSIQSGESEVAIAGGVNLTLHPHKYVLLSQGKFSSSDGRCRAFGEGGDGYVPGEGVGAVLLKPLQKALEDGDRIYGVIRSSSINHGGRTNGYSVPNPQAQSDLIGQALHEAKVDPAYISYVEAHGTGTSLGDPIEITGLAKAFRSSTHRAQPCAIGSVKSNIGHLESAAGIAGLTKILLQMKHQQLVPSLHSDQLNPYIRFDETPFRVQREISEWIQPVLMIDGVRREVPRIAALSSFGAGGSNAHLILEEWPNEQARPSSTMQGAPQLIVLSARNEERLLQVVCDLAKSLDASPAVVRQEVDGMSQLYRDFQQLVAQVLDVEGAEIALQDDWTDLGFEQVTFARLAHLINAKWHLAIQERDLYAYSNIADLANHIWEQESETWDKTASTPSEEHTELRKFALADIAHTLQVGREALDERLAVVVSSIAELREQLIAFTDNASAANNGWLRGTVKKGEERYLVLGDDEDSQELIEKWTRKGRLDKLAQLWVNGIELNWTKLPGHSVCSVVSLPLYPFAQERYWIEASSEVKSNQSSHPYLDGLNAALSLEKAGVVFHKTFTSADAVLRDHVVRGQAILPGAVLLEMVMAACKQLGFEQVHGFSNVVWMAPVTLSQDEVMVNVDLSNEQGAIRFQLRSGKNDQVITHASGEVMFDMSSNQQTIIDLDAIQARCTRRELQVELYVRFAQNGLTYGSYYQTVRELSGNVAEAFAELEVASAAQAEQALCLLGPALIDGALQALVGIRSEQEDGAQRTLVPYAVRQVSILSMDRHASCAYASQTGTGLYDILLCDRFGHVTLKLEGVEVREMAGPSRVVETMPQLTSKLVLPSAEPLPNPHPQDLQRDLSQQAEGVIRHALSSVLLIDENEFDNQMPYTDFGVDSVHAVEIVSRINQALQVSLRPTELFNYGSIRQLTTYLLTEYGREIAETISHAEPTIEAKQTVKSAIASKHLPQKSVAEFAPVAQEISEQSACNDSDIAIIGMSGRFPGADSLEQFWDNLLHGVNTVKEIDRWPLDSFYDPDRQKLDKSYSKWMGQLSGIDRFDPLFFSISPKEAEMMDPQQRLFLMEAWRAIEDAGYSIADLENRKCGVFVGCGSGDYMDLMKENGVVPTAYAFMGNDESILPARISYFLNLKGPSIAINTACSASLVALHLACESIRTGTSDMALAGGVAVLNTPRVHVLSSRAGMLSANGQCKAFDHSADGFVPSEGVGVVLLKPLSAALKDGDSIIGVIKGSGINQDGRSNGITAPSAPSQTALELDVYEKFNIEPSDIQYVEAHGTGTKLGDPIEVDALTDAFRKYTDKTGFCALGSVKSNIGHALTAAGIAGLFKILLCMKYQKLVPTLLVDRENEHIDFAKTPFYVNKGVREWKSEEGQIRLAAVSSFGFSGTNAHVVVAESPEREFIRRQGLPYQLVPLSAASDTALAQKELDLLVYLETKGRDLPFADVVFTLQTGRSHFAVRRSYIVRDCHDLCDKLRARARGQHVDGLVEASANRSKVKQDLYTEQASDLLLHELQSEQFKPEACRNVLQELAQRYVTGTELDWKRLYAQTSVRRVPLPTYPFDLQRYWFEIKPSVQDGAVVSSAYTTKIGELRSGDILLAKMIHAGDVIVSQHRVSGKKIFPGMGYVELALQALIDKGAESEYTISELLFLKPVLIEEQAVEIRLRLVRQAPLQFEFVVFQQGTWVTVASGEYVCQPSPAHSQSLAQSVLAIDDIRQRCSLLYAEGELYHKLLMIGLEYGPLFQGVKQIWRSEDEALGRLLMPNSIRSELAKGRLHPALLDAALHTISGMVKSSQPMLPFSIGSIEIVRPLQERCYAYVTKAGKGRYQVEIANDRGDICIILHEVLLVSSQQTDVSEMMYGPKWKKYPLAKVHQIQNSPASKTVMLIGPARDVNLQNALAAEHSSDRVISVRYGSVTRQTSLHTWIADPTDVQAMVTVLAAHQDVEMIYFLGGVQEELAIATNGLDEVEHSQQAGIFTLFRLVKALGGIRKTGKALTLKVVTRYATFVQQQEPILYQASSLHGFVKSLAKEYPGWQVSCLDLDLESSAVTSLAQAIVNEPANSRGDVVALRAGDRYRCVLVPLPLPQPERIPFRRNGVYLIVGGASGIGLEFGKYLARTVGARVVLVGRRSLNLELQKGIDEIRSLGGEAQYIQADASDLGSMQRAIREVKMTYGELHGAVHSALVLRDRIIENMTELDLKEALDSKVRGSVVLQQALQDEPLDFVLFFSSANSFSGNAGQSNYAAACTFKDAFAREWDAKAAYPVCIINWGYWGTVGVVATQAYNERLKAMGVDSIQPSEGMETIVRTLAHACKQVIPVKAERHVLELMGLESEALSVSPLQEVLARTQAPLINEECMQRLIEAFKELSQFGTNLLLETFRNMGVFQKAGERHLIGELQQRLGIIPKYSRLYIAMLNLMEKNGLLVQARGYCVTTAEVEGPDVCQSAQSIAESYEDLRRRWPEVDAHLHLLWSAFQHFTAILTGEVMATDILFPNGSMALVEQIYKHNHIADHFNQLVVHPLRVFLERGAHREDGRKLKILEIGAGTGGTSAYVLTGIQSYADRIEYVYTDISPGFTQYGHQKFGSEYPFVVFKTLDIEKDLVEQGFQPGEFDFVLATNVLHATRHIGRTLSKCRQLIGQNGWLVVNEATDAHAFTTLTFGLLDGWWLYEDGHCRLPDAPLLSLQKWLDLCAAAGFVDTTSLVAEGLGQSVIISMQGDEPEALPPRTPAPVKLSDEPAFQTAAAREDAMDVEDRIKGYVRDLIRSIISKAMGLQQEGILDEKPFSAYGVDSISGVEVIRQINEDLGIVLKTTALFDHGSVFELTEYIWKTYGQLLSKHYQDAPSEAPSEEPVAMLHQLANGELSVDEVIRLWR